MNDALGRDCQTPSLGSPPCRELIDTLVRSAEREGMELYGVHIYRRGAEPVERRLRSDDRVDVRSVSKTFTSVALGIAEAEGRLALDDPALKYYPELAGSARARPGPGHAPALAHDDVRQPALLVRRRPRRGPGPGR